MDGRKALYGRRPAMSTKTNPLSEKELELLREAAMLRAQGKT